LIPVEPMLALLTPGARPVRRYLEVSKVVHAVLAFRIRALTLWLQHEMHPNDPNQGATMERSKKEVAVPRRSKPRSQKSSIFFSGTCSTPERSQTPSRQGTGVRCSRYPRGRYLL
jgi:hypothetical protein